MMHKKLNNLSGVEYHALVKLYTKQEWLAQRQKQLLELMELCEAKHQKDLIISLLEGFQFITHSIYSMLLKELAEHIINDTGFTEGTTQIVACTKNEETDSGQKTLYQIKHVLFDLGWKNMKTVNRTGDSIKNHKKGFTQIILLDDFIGSGKTLKSRIRDLHNDIKTHFDLKCCFLIGMNHTVQSLKRSGCDIFCPLLLDRGITDKFKESELVSAILDMKALEKKLAPRAGKENLSDYFFGYNKTETLCSLEGCEGNTPNNVFPIFWWPKDLRDYDRNNILTIHEKSFYNVPNEEAR